MRYDIEVVEAFCVCIMLEVYVGLEKAHGPGRDWVV
jgi:hypothetical protein